MVDRIKRETRARMAATGEPYTEARRAVLAADAPAPTPTDLHAAVTALLTAWAPNTRAPFDPAPGDDNGCRCGGHECNCAGGCGCPSCRHQEHRRTAHCQNPDPRPGEPFARCGALTAYRIRPFCIHLDGVTRTPSDGDPAANNGMVTLGDSIQHHTAMYACTTQHARHLIERDRHRRKVYPADSALTADRTYYQVDAYTYEPDDIDVPGALHPLRESLEAAAYWTRGTIAAEYGIGRSPLHYNADGMLRYLAWAVASAAAYAERGTRPADT
ncbi:hypothetical protein [Micromonospora sp. RP3T]|uniref:hypothetical protein n=1 Tax=Micromonospora sp. RP3T TaxID=2135446 RepID=UPI003D715379